ncbi:MAG: M23 family metallopeptidase [Candidatus Treponema excrementipullorum]|uniref:M23 family metallopeptidase n=1 Tax=Candidatus Treponema excrementipullorum TaxID=2838768 RepID=A0A9E2L1D6_9SPIR|nr:M23 family metallopeptidase [Candidatus Treponema excrementipullorum]
MEEDDLYKSMGDRTDGCYPISDEGIWHAGIHVYFTDANTPVKNPIEGKVVASCFDDEKSWNYVVTENEINLPSKKKDVKSGYHCYNLISNLRSKILPFSELSCEELKKIQPIPFYPFYISVKTQLPDVGVIDERNFKIVEISIDGKKIKDDIIGELTDENKQYFKSLSNTYSIKKSTKIMNKKGKEIGSYNTDYVIENNTGEFIENRLFSTKTRGKFIQLSEELPKGYFILQDQEVTDSGEIIVSDNSKLYLWKEKETNKKDYPGQGIIVDLRSDFRQKLFSSSDSEIKKTWNVHERNRYETMQQELLDYIESLPKEEEFVYALPDSSSFHVFPFISEPESVKYSYKITSASGKVVRPCYFPKEKFNFIKDELTGVFKNKDNVFDIYGASSLWKERAFSYTIIEKIDISMKYDNFFNSVKIIDNENRIEDSKLNSLLYAKVQLCLHEETSYEVAINTDDVFCKKIFINNPNIIASFQSSETKNGYPASQIIEKRTGECFFNNLYEIITDMNNNKDFIWLKNENENIYVPKKYYESLKFQIVKSEVKKGDVIKSGDILGYPFWDSEPAENERTESEPYIDYALFFTEDITEKNIILESINIPKETECLVENISFSVRDEKIFLPPSGCELDTCEIKGTEDFVELTSVSYQIFVYPSGVESGYLTKDIECKLFLTTPKCKITVKNNKFDAVSSNSTEMDDSVKNCVEEFTNEIIIYMQNNQNTELGMSKDNPPQQLYKWIYKKDAQTIIKKGISANGKVQVIDTYKKNITFETAKIPKDYTETFVSTDLETITIEGKEYCKFLIENKAYYVSKNFVDQNKKNLLEEFNSKCISVNLKKNAISNNEVCPEGKLIITKENINKFKQNLIDKLSEENDYLMQYVMPADGSEDYNIYNESKYFYELLSKYLKRTISKHPLEWDFAKIKEDRVCESRGKPPVNEKECCDIAAGLKTADPKIFGTNSFYFVCAPYFYNKMDGLGLLEFNPYEKYNVVVPFPMKNNPGFMPEGTTEYSFTQNFNAFVNDNYSHEGVDLAVSKAKIISGIYGKVIVEGDRGNYSYGCFIVIQADKLYEDKNRYFLLGHLDRDREHKKENDYVSPDEIVGYVGNTGHCVSGGHNIEGNENLELRADGRGAHLHLQMFLTDADFNDFIEDMNFNELKNEENKSDKFACSNKNIVNPFDYKETYEKDTKK